MRAPNGRGSRNDCHSSRGKYWIQMQAGIFHHTHLHMMDGRMMDAFSKGFYFIPIVVVALVQKPPQ